MSYDMYLPIRWMQRALAGDECVLYMRGIGVVGTQIIEYILYEWGSDILDCSGQLVAGDCSSQQVDCTDQLAIIQYCNTEYRNKNNKYNTITPVEIITM